MLELVLIWKQAVCLLLKTTHSIRRDRPIPRVLFSHFNQSRGGPALIRAGNAGIMCRGYSPSFSRAPPSLWDDLVCVTVRLALGLEQSNAHSITPVTLAVSGGLSQAVCYNLNLYLVSQCDDLTEKNKRICLDLRSHSSPPRKCVLTLKFSDCLAAIHYNFFIFFLVTNGLSSDEIISHPRAFISNWRCWDSCYGEISAGLSSLQIQVVTNIFIFYLSFVYLTLNKIQI